MSSIFTKIINRELPSKVFYETEQVIVIADIAPKSPVHLLIIPKEESKNFYETKFETLQMLNETTKLVADKLGIPDHFKILINNGLGQEIPYLHYHFMSDRGMKKLLFID